MCFLKFLIVYCHVSSSSILHKIQIHVMLNWVNVHGCYYWIPTLTPYIHFYIRSKTGLFATKSDITRMALVEAQVEVWSSHNTYELKFMFRCLSDNWNIKSVFEITEYSYNGVELCFAINTLLFALNICS